jgi:hypothetical protein
MNDYEQKQEARRQRYLKRADAAEAESDRRYTAFRQIVERIPMGQPILIGHHSERGHRADLKRMDRHMAAVSKESEKAEHYRNRAEAVGTGGISSDDPEAIQKLSAELEAARTKQATMQAVNAIIRQKPKNEQTPEKLASLASLGFSGAAAVKLFVPDFCGRVGFPDYALTNNSANCRRMAKRIEQLRANASRPNVAQDRGGVQYREEDNRVRLVFPGKPPEETRKMLKAHGFRWSPTAGAWQRHLNSAGRFAAEQVLKALGG